MARGAFTFLLTAFAVLAQWTDATPVHNHQAIHLVSRPRHAHSAPSRRHVGTVEENENRPAKRQDNGSSLQDRAWLDEHSSLDRADLDELLDELGLNYNDVRDLVKRFTAGEPPQQCTSIVTSTIIPTAESTVAPTAAPAPPAVETSAASSPASPASTDSPASAGARNMNIVYYAQTPATGQVELTTICNDPTIDIVVLAFVTDLFTAGGYPTLNLASKCWATSAAQQSLGATGLIDCVGDGFAAQVATCQAAGKKVMLSVGGALSNMNIPSATAAQTAAQNLWDLFLGGGSTATAAVQAARPFGSLVLDGIDFDNETPADSTHIPDLANALRTLMDASGKDFILSAAPQCPRPDQSIPIPQMLGVLDYVWVQFYNNPSCNVDAGAGFLASLQAWSGDLAAAGPAAPAAGSATAAASVAVSAAAASSAGPVASSSAAANPAPTTMATVTTTSAQTGPEWNIGPPNYYNAPPSPPSAGSNKRAVQRGPPKLVIGVLATQQGSGYVDPTTLEGILQQVKAAPGLTNLAGVMYWDGAYQELSGANGATSYAQYVRQILA